MIIILLLVLNTNLLSQSIKCYVKNEKVEECKEDDDNEESCKTIHEAGYVTQSCGQCNKSPRGLMDCEDCSTDLCNLKNLSSIKHKQSKSKSKTVKYIQVVPKLYIFTLTFLNIFIWKTSEGLI